MAEKFTQLPFASPLTGPEITCIVQSGVSKQSTITAIFPFISNTFVYGNGISFVSPTLSVNANLTNFVFNTGVLNTIQDINTTAGPTFFGGYQSYAKQVVVSASQNVDATIVGKVAINSGASPVVLTIPLNAGFNINTEFTLIRSDTGTFAVTAAAGVTINGIDSATFNLPLQYNRAVFREISNNVWSANSGSSTLQQGYDNQTTGNINLAANKPFALVSTVAGFIMPSMLLSEFNAISLPDTGLMGWITDQDRIGINTGTSLSPVTDLVAYVSDIPADTTSYGETYFQDNATPTVPFAMGVWTPVDATYLSGDLLNFTQVGGTLTYTGTATKEFLLSLSLSSTLNSATANISFAIFYNGIILDKTRMLEFTGSTTPSPLPASLTGLQQLSTGDFLQVYVRNETGDDNITVIDMNFNVTTVGGMIGSGPAPTPQVVTLWNGSADPVEVTAGSNMSITSGVISFTGNALPTLQNVFNNSTPFKNINIPIGNPLTLSSTQAGFRLCSMTVAQNNAIPSPLNGLMTWLNDVGRIGINSSTPSAPVHQQVAYLSDLGGFASLGSAYLNGNTMTMAANNPIFFESNNIVNTPYFYNVQNAVPAANAYLGGFLCSAVDSASNPINAGNMLVQCGSPTTGNDATIIRFTARTVGRDITYQVYDGVNGSHTFNAANTYFPGQMNIGPSNGGPNYTIGTVITPRTIYTSGVFQDVWTSLFGTNVVVANSLQFAQTVEIDLTGVLQSVNLGGTGILQFSFGSFAVQSQTLTCTGTVQKNMALKIKVTNIGANQCSCSIGGWFVNQSNVMTPFQMFVPNPQPFNPAINNTLLLQWRCNFSGADRFIFTASNMNIVQYS